MVSFLFDLMSGRDLALLLKKHRMAILKKEQEKKGERKGEEREEEREP